MKYLKRELGRYKCETILAPLFKMTEAVFDLLVPIVVAKAISLGVAGGDRTYLIRCCLLLIVMAALGLACSFTAQYFAAKAATGSAAGLRHTLFAHIQKLGFSEIDTIGTGTLITRMTSDVNQVQSGVNMFLRLFLRSPFVVFGAAVMAFTINRTIALYFVAAIAVLSVIVFTMMRVTSPRYRAIQALLDKVTSAARENLTGVRVIRAFGVEKRETHVFSAANAAMTKKQIIAGRLSAITNPLTYVTVNLFIILILSAGGKAVDNGALRSGDVVALVNYMNQILVELVKLANLIVTLSRAAASLRRVEQMIDTEPAMTFRETATKLPEGDEAVRFDHVSLTYKGAGAESITDISFTAKKGETIGIIGGTGSGKSSVVSLIPRFYDATGGKVTLMGRPADEWPREALRGTVATVMQKAQLFSGTIRSNLLWGNADANDAALWEALRIAQAEAFVRAKPLGLDEPVEENGGNFSGGQKQRLTIARALVGRPAVLILDDSMSALDYATDAALRKSLRELPKETTVFIVSQRTSSIRCADRILVMDEGRLVGQGTHDGLLRNCAVYREIYESQYGQEEVSA